jgi:lipopolysaccharide biosynthesis glycosyltransferase
VTANNAIFLSFDDNYLSYARSCINSIFSNYPGHPVLLINYSGSQKILADEYIRQGKVKFIKLNNAFKFSLGPIKNAIVFDRFSLWSDCFSEYDNILHLDADTLVLKPLDDLFDAREFFITSDNDQLARIFKIHDQKLKRQSAVPAPHFLPQDQLKLMSEPHAMANAGVFVIPAQYRCKAQLQLLLDLAVENDAYVAYADQSIISLWCARNSIPITQDYAYNLQIRFLCERYYKTNDIHILHFSGEAKFYESYIQNSRHRELYRICDSIRLFYRIVRAPCATEEKLKQLQHFLASLHPA